MHIAMPPFLFMGITHHTLRAPDLSSVMAAGIGAEFTTTTNQGIAMNINNLTIVQAKELAAMFGDGNGQKKSEGINGFCIGSTVIVRTYSAGVWCGTLVQKSGNEVVLVNARRMWRWWCKESISLSGVVRYGIDRSKSKIAAAVDSVWLEAIEIMPIDGESATSIMEADIVQAE